MTSMIFFPGIHHPFDAKHFEYACVSIGVLRRRKGDFYPRNWLLDSQAFKTIELHGGYPLPVNEYGDQIKRWKKCGNLMAAVSQDYMCEPFMLARTGLTIEDHQRLTIERYDALVSCATGVYIMPVLQGFTPQSYVDHIAQYGDRLSIGAWVGVGSVCKRNASPRQILDVLVAIKTVRPDLHLHGFGVKKTSLRNGTIRALLWSADSMAWSFAARYEGRNANDYREAVAFNASLEVEPKDQMHLIELTL